MRRPVYRPKKKLPTADVDLEFQAVDLKKMDAAPQRTQVLRLLAILNDLDSGSYAYELIAENEKSLPNELRERWCDGISLYLIRIRVAILYSALYDMLREIKEKVDSARNVKRTEKTPRLLWHIILDDEELDAMLTDLVKTLDPGGLSESLGYVRDKMSAHIDLDVMSLGLSKLIAEEPIGISLRTLQPNRRFRALFVDDILSFSWQEKALTGVDLKAYMASIAKVRSTTADFAFRLFDVYCHEFSLLATKSEHEEIKRTLRNSLAERQKMRKKGNG